MSGFMQPQIVEGTFIIVESHYETYVVYGDDFNLAELAEGDTYETIQSFGVRLSAPGYLDCTEWHLCDTEVQAWIWLLEESPESFTWVLDGNVLTLGCPTEACAQAVKEHVQTVCGSRLESDGTLIYAGIGDPIEEAYAISDECGDAACERIAQMVQDELSDFALDIV